MTKIIENVQHGKADSIDIEMMKNFINKVEATFKAEEVLDVTFTLYKGYFPLEAVIHFVEDNHYTRYNLYSTDLEIHNTGYQCSSEILEKSRKFIIKDSTLRS